MEEDQAPPQEQAPSPPQTQLRRALDHLTLQDIPFKLKGIREKFLRHVYKVQQRLKKWCLFRIKHFEEKIRKMSGYISKEEAFDDEDF